MVFRRAATFEANRQVSTADRLRAARKVLREAEKLEFAKAVQARGATAVLMGDPPPGRRELLERLNAEHVDRRQRKAE